MALFDPNFFQELEDLKYNYKEAVRLNIKYEESLQEFCIKNGQDYNALMMQLNE